jgi:signal transduction histidine kinase
MEIRDDGLGFEQNRMLPGAFGLEIMQERAQQIGAAFAITSRPGQGTQLVLRWPDLQEGD